MSQSKYNGKAVPLPGPVPLPPSRVSASLRSPVNFFARHPIFSTPPSFKRRNPFPDFTPISKRIRLDISPSAPTDALSQSTPTAPNFEAILLENNRDLCSKTRFELRNLLTVNIKNRRQNDVFIANGNRYDDLVVLTGIGNLYRDRINAIKAALAAGPSVPIPDVPLWISPTEEEGEDVEFPRIPAKYTEVLRRRFGINSFRQGQLEPVKNTVDGLRDTFVLMPTGAGKSLCYQLPAVIANEKTNSVTVVVSPLCSLIDDQVAALAAKGVEAVGLSADTDMSMLKKRLVDGRSKPALIYCTPEKIQKNELLYHGLRHLHKRKQLTLFAIDECHCMTSWGEGFRSEAYQNLHTLRDKFPGVPIMALTSTATPQNIHKIMLNLKLDNPSIIRQSLNRPNLTYLVKQKRNEINDLLGFIQNGHANHSGIIYRTGQKRCEQLARTLNKRGITAKAYHASLPNRKNIHTQWKNDEFRVVVATIAFGMGIDKANVRFVVHYDLPQSLESYYQETGRAGRDGKPADCCLYYSFRDKKTVLSLALSNEDDRAQLSNCNEQVSAMVDYCENKLDCRRVLLLRHFGEGFDREDCGDAQCDNCAKANSLVSKDFSAQAALVVALVRAFDGQRITVKQYIEMFRGADTENTRKNGRNRSAQFGAGQKLSHDEANLLFDALLHRGVLVERRVQTSRVNYSYYLKVGANVENKPKVTITYHKKSH
ncbi:P-loop containing nucleoside triphosphate hydrolase protein [Mycena haematopus]|nr:P-loop containing nucleoside triphosphate hydrolase protein [Mycena haematopus]